VGVSCYLAHPMSDRRATPDRREAGGTTPRRAVAVTRICDLRRTDHVLDVGCAQGLVALEVARFVDRLHGLDIRPARVKRATARAAERGIRNASFEVSAIQDYSLEPQSWDVTLFMRVLGKGGGPRQVGDADLERVLEATRRQVVLQAGKRRSEPGIRRILEICADHGFDAGWFTQLHLIIANRRGAGARIRALPERVLMQAPSGRMLVPATAVPDHPVSRSFDPDLPLAV
jgi:SAM-dependent methyltransferase